VEKTKSFGGNHNLAYDDYELFGLPESSRTVDTSAFEELFGKDEKRPKVGPGPQHRAKPAAKKAEKKPAKRKPQLFKVLSGLMTMCFILLLFSIIVS